MNLDNRVKTLIAIGAAIGANCQPCLQSSIEMALKCGADDQEIAEAMEVGKSVRRGAASKMDRFASELPAAAPLPVATADSECKCVSS